jgi:hypothetical protein
MKPILKLSLTITFIILSLFVVTCKHEIPLTDKDGGNNSDTCGITVFTYSGAVAPLMNTYCKGCHSGATPRGGIDLSTYDGVKAVALNGRLMGSIKQDSGYKAMPPGANKKLSDCKILQIEKWVRAGSPNN